MPIRENAERKPINPYGKTKLDDEYLFEKYTNLYEKNELTRLHLKRWWLL